MIKLIILNMFNSDYEDELVSLLTMSLRIKIIIAGLIVIGLGLLALWFPFSPTGNHMLELTSFYGVIIMTFFIGVGFSLIAGGLSLFSLSIKR